MLDLSKIENDLISEIKLEKIQVKTFLLVVTQGKMSAEKIGNALNISTENALRTCQDLISLGAFIDMPNQEFESMHPRFTAVNMYRRMCEKQNIEFKRNNIVDNIGIALEESYDDARTK